jgi:hypothetical protein
MAVFAVIAFVFMHPTICFSINYYAKRIHALASDNKVYAFGYDDGGRSSSFVSVFGGV